MRVEIFNADAGGRGLDIAQVDTTGRARFGARNRAPSAASPASSNMSPTVTTLAVTVMSPLSAGAASALAPSRRVVMTARMGQANI
ncbi:MAG: hypothetical protein MO852_11050 [Candidatus Devosia euplotis]|nr:hypothetical protein [Candidatus Devosia euplotis]